MSGKVTIEKHNDPKDTGVSARVDIGDLPPDVRVAFLDALRDEILRPPAKVIPSEPEPKSQGFFAGLFKR